MKGFVRMSKRKLTLILAVVMMVSMLPFYAFAEDGPAPEKNGWDGNMYYKNGTAVTGAVYINGPVTVNKKVKYYYNKKKKKWQTKKIKKAKTKYKKVSQTVNADILYLFDADGKLVVRNAGVFTHDGKEYYSLGGGKLQTGWVAVGKQAMYFNRNDAKTGTAGSMAKNTTVGHLHVPANGRLGEAYALGVKQLNKSGWSLKSAYKFSYKLKYRNRGYRQKTTEKYAIRGFKKKNGNCYVMASTFYIMAKLLGYDVTRVAGKVAGVNPHSWTVIKENGKEHVYDPNFRNETGRSGWKIWYGKKGTWRYTNYHKVKNLY